MKPRTIVTTCVAAALIVAHSDRAQTCGPEFEEAIFTHRVHPDVPFRPFAQGDLGILQPTYARSYLVVAYRYLTGHPLSSAEQEAMGSLWRDRLGDFDRRNWMDDPFKAVPESGPPDRARSWLSRRNLLTSLAPLNDIDTYQTIDPRGYFGFDNCPGDAFRQAVDTFERVSTTYGRDNRATLEWVRAQDAVFDRCSKPGAAPAALAASATPAARADRDYQIAAALFYSRQFDEAAARFKAIGEDAQSPWRTIAPYLAARAFIRKGTLVPEEGRFDRPSLERAESELRAVLADPSRAGVHAAARDLLGFVRFRLQPETRLAELGSTLAGGNSPQTFRHDADDYTRLIDKLIGDRPVEPSPAINALSAAADPMADWIVTFQWPGQAALDHAIARWELAHETPWLVAAMSKISARDPRSANLRAAALAVPAGTPGSATLTYHALRLAVEAGERDATRRDLDALLAARKASLPRSAVNQFFALRLTLASNQQDWLAFSTRLPTMASSLAEGVELPAAYSPTPQKIRDTRLFDEDATNALNRGFPLAHLVELAQGQDLPALLRRDVALSAWTRAVLIGDDAAARRSGSTLRALAPEMKNDLEEYARSADETSRQLAAVTTLLRFPGARPLVDMGLGRGAELNRLDTFRDNWWCALESNRTSAIPFYLTDADRQIAVAEYLRLAALPTAPEYLAAEAVRLAGLRPNDPRAPEVLHLAVRATRYGCAGDGTGPRSKAAFDLLHRRYPQSDWAKKTPFWYDGR